MASTCEALLMKSKGDPLSEIAASPATPRPAGPRLPFGIASLAKMQRALNNN
jgi:hypothetical protein